VSAVVERARERDDARAQFERLHAEAQECARRDPQAAASQLVALSGALHAAAAAGKRRLLGAREGDAEGRSLRAWLAQRHDALASACLEVVEALGGGDAALVRRVAAIGLFHWAEAVKWSAWREPEDYARLHRLYAAGGDPAARVAGVPKDGAPETTIESLFLRALLLARFAAGALRRSQAEILDDWLRRWGEALSGERECPAGAVLRVDLDRRVGLCEGRRADAGPALYIPVERLERCRREAVRALRDGSPMASATAAHIAEQVAVLDYLRRGFAFGADEQTLRAARTRESAAGIEAWMGLDDILRAAGVEGDEAPRGLAMRLVDASATGFGLEADEAVAERIQVDELIGWRPAGANAMTLARIVRRTANPAKGRVAFGAQLLSRAAIPLSLRRRAAALDEARGRPMLFVAGDDDSGRRDGFLFPAWGFELQAEYEAALGTTVFRLRFNRVRMQGPGWILAGFEMVMPGEERSPAGPLDLVPLEAPAAEPAPAADFDDIWTREVKPRLLQ
jgi:hypothetical protein